MQHQKGKFTKPLHEKNYNEYMQINIHFRLDFRGAIVYNYHNNV